MFDGMLGSACRLDVGRRWDAARYDPEARVEDGCVSLPFVLDGLEGLVVYFGNKVRKGSGRMGPGMGTRTLGSSGSSSAPARYASVWQGRGDDKVGVLACSWPKRRQGGDVRRL